MESINTSLSQFSEAGDSMNSEDENCPFLSHLKKLLDKEGINHGSFRFADGSEFITFRIENDEGHEIEMNARATPDDVWLYMFGCVGNLGSVSSVEKSELFQSLMKLNLAIKGTKIALNDENDILLMSSTTNTNLTRDELVEFLYSISIASIEVQGRLEEL